MHFLDACSFFFFFYCFSFFPSVFQEMACLIFTRISDLLSVENKKSNTELENEILQPFVKKEKKKNNCQCGTEILSGGQIRNFLGFFFFLLLPSFVCTQSRKRERERDAISICFTSLFLPLLSNNQHGKRQELKFKVFF